MSRMTSGPCLQGFPPVKRKAAALLSPDNELTHRDENSPPWEGTGVNYRNSIEYSPGPDSSTLDLPQVFQAVHGPYSARQVRGMCPETCCELDLD